MLMHYFICIFSDWREFIWNKNTLSVTHPWIVEKNLEFLWEISYEELDSVIHTSTILKEFFVSSYRLSFSVDDGPCREILVMSNFILVSSKKKFLSGSGTFKPTIFSLDSGRFRPTIFFGIREDSGRQFFFGIREDSSQQFFLGLREDSGRQFFSAFGLVWVTRLVSLVLSH